jgi:hypothetical protein
MGYKIAGDFPNADLGLKLGFGGALLFYPPTHGILQAHRKFCELVGCREVLWLCDKMPAPTYIISRVADPIFAVFIGVSAAAMRINREEKEKGKTTRQTFNSALRYASPS